MSKLTKSFAQLAVRASRDRSGTISVLAAMSLTALIGFVGLGTEASYWYVQKREMQSASDSASFSAVAAIKAGETIVSGAPASGTPVDAAKATAAQYGFVDGQNGVTVAVNNPPSSGPNASNSNAVEVIITQPQNRLFSALFLSSNPRIGGRAVSAYGGGTPCVIALNDGNITDLTVSGTPTLNIPTCNLYVNSSNAGGALSLSGNAVVNANSTHVVGGISISGGAQLNDSNGTFSNTGSPAPDPFASASFTMPGGCDQTNFSSHVIQTISPGVYCGGFDLTSGAQVTMQPGIYYMNQGSFTINGGASLTGTGVTIVLTGSGSNYATVTINSTATVDLNNCTPTACPGPIEGLAFFQDRNAPVSPPVGNGNLFNGGSTMNINGGIYFPNQRVTYTGGAEVGGSQCTQLVANTIKITGETNFQGNCQGITEGGGSGNSIALVE